MKFHIFDHIYDSVVIYNSAGRVVYCNDSFSALVGVSPVRIINKMDIDKLFLEIEGYPLNLAEFTQFREPTTTRVIKFQTKEVMNGIGQFSIAPVEEQDDRFFIFVLRDLSIEEELHRKYRREMSLKDKKIEEMNSMIQLLQRTRLVKEPRKILEEFLKHVLSQYGLGTGFIKDGDGRVFKVTNREQIGLGTSYDLLFKKIQELGVQKKYNYFEKDNLKDLHMNGLPHLHSIVLIVLKSSQKAHFELYLPIHNEERANTFDHERVITLSEQMELIIDNMTLEKLSIFDDLTKLYNARYFREKLDEYTGRYPVLSLILLDIDFFKKINDTYGHLGGDAVLETVGRILKEAGEKENRENVVSRIGGEEFSILMPDKTPREAEKLANYIANVIRAEVIPYDDKEIKITMSFGISQWEPNVSTSVRDFYKRADEALYTSKRNGRDRITILKAA